MFSIDAPSQSAAISGARGLIAIGDSVIGSTGVTIAGVGTIGGVLAIGSGGGFLAASVVCTTSSLTLREPIVFIASATARLTAVVLATMSGIFHDLSFPGTDLGVTSITASTFFGIAACTRGTGVT